MTINFYCIFLLLLLLLLFDEGSHCKYSGPEGSRVFIRRCSVISTRLGNVIFCNFFAHYKFTACLLKESRWDKALENCNKVSDILVNGLNPGVSVICLV